jgi:hypothetical protein
MLRRGARAFARHAARSSPLPPAPSQEALEFARENVLGRALLFAVGSLLESFDERLDVGVAAYGYAHLAFVVSGRGLELGDVDRHADEHFGAARNVNCWRV